MKCKDCGMESGEYLLCKDCYYKSKDGHIDKRKKKTKFKDSVIKGKLAETIVEEMFFAMDYRVFRFGMENTLPGFMNRYFPKKGEVAEQVRKMPDFIIVKDSQIAFIEVKYRTNGKFDFKKHYGQRQYPYKNAYFILVTPKHILIQKASELEKGKNFIYLINCKDFETDRETILEYITFCKKFFGNC